MDRFVEAEGFGSAEECFAAIEEAVVANKKEHKKKMEALAEQMKQIESEMIAQHSAHQQRLQAEAKASGGGGGGDDDDIDALLAEVGEDGDGASKALTQQGRSDTGAGQGGGVPMPMLFVGFFQPVPLEDMVRACGGGVGWMGREPMQWVGCGALRPCVPATVCVWCVCVVWSMCAVGACVLWEQVQNVL